MFAFCNPISVLKCFVIPLLYLGAIVQSYCFTLSPFRIKLGITPRISKAKEICSFSALLTLKCKIINLSLYLSRLRSVDIDTHFIKDSKLRK